MIRRLIARAGLIAALLWMSLAVAASPTTIPTMAHAAGSTLFSDGFESGNFAAWSAVQTGADGVATVQSVTVKSGSYAAQLSASAAAGSYAYAREALATAQTDLTASGDFQVTAEGPSGNNVPLLKLMDPSGATLAVLFRQNQSNNQLWLKHSGGYYQTSGTLPLNTWAHLELHVIAAGSGASTVEVRVNGALVYQTTTASLTTAGAQTLQIGCSTASQPFTLFADNIAVTTAAVSQATPTATTPAATATTPAATATTPAATATSPAATATATTPAATATSTPSGGDPVLVGAGDIADCNNPGDVATAALLDNIPGTVFTLGDNAYPSGAASDFANCYGPTWGRQKARTRPATGNHEYLTSGASGYFGYFGAAAGNPNQGYYSYDMGTWHVIVLNAECGQVAGCGAGSPQETWLRSDLSAHPAQCTLAYWHQARFTSGVSHNDTTYDAFWQDLYHARADVVLNGHDHDYERFAPQDPFGNADPTSGIREFVVGTGGEQLSPISSTIANSQVHDDQTFGVLKLTLHPTSYDWQFIPQSGKTFTDSGSTPCHGASTSSLTPSPTPAAGSTLFSDGFESGNFAAWSAVQTGADGVATVQSVTVKSGSYAAQLSASAAAGSYAYAREALATAQTDLTASGDFQVTAEGPSGNNVPLLKLMDPSGATLAVLFRQNQSNNQLWLKHSGGYYQTSGTLPLNTWAHLELHVIAAGSGASTVEVRVNGALVYQTTTASLTTAGAQTLQIGCSTASQPFTLFADNITIA